MIWYMVDAWFGTSFGARLMHGLVQVCAWDAWLIKVDVHGLMIVSM
jgi:hypothetical protein